MKTCPYCAEQIQDAAIVCRYCGRDLQPPKPLYEVNKAGLILVTVYPTRIEIIDKSTNAMARAFPQKTDIAVKNISGVNIKGFLRKIELTMNDGTLREIPWIMGADAEKMCNIIRSLL